MLYCFSDRFWTISSGCYRIFLHCIFPACLLHRHGLRLAFAPVSSIFQGIFHGLFLAFALFSSVFQGILYYFLWSLSCFPAVSLYFPIHPHGLAGHQKRRGNRYPTVSKLPSGVVHNPAKWSVFSCSTQGHGEISFPFGNFVRKQQLAS